MAYQWRDVRRDATRLDRLAVTLQVGPGQGQGVVADAGQQVQVQLHVPGIDREWGKAAIAGDLGCDTLADLALAAPVEHQAHVGVGVDVDETWRDDQSGGVDDACRLQIGAVSDQHDDALARCDVDLARRRAGAVKHVRAADEQICLHAMSQVAGALPSWQRDPMRPC